MNAFILDMKSMTRVAIFVILFGVLAVTIDFMPP